MFGQCRNWPPHWQKRNVIQGLHLHGASSGWTGIGSQPIWRATWVSLRPSPANMMIDKLLAVGKPSKLACIIPKYQCINTLQDPSANIPYQVSCPRAPAPHPRTDVPYHVPFPRTNVPCPYRANLPTYHTTLCTHVPTYRTTYQQNITSPRAKHICSLLKRPHPHFQFRYCKTDVSLHAIRRPSHLTTIRHTDLTLVL